MKIKNVTLGFLALTTTILQADLFDTTDELDAKYGQPVLAQQDGPYTKLTYKSGEYIIEAKLVRDDDADSPGEYRSVYERHTRVDGKALGSAEIKSILTRRPKRGEWQYVGGDSWRLLNIGKASYISSSRALVQHRKL